MAKKRPNIIPIIEDARHPQKYRMLVPMVDVVFAGDPCDLQRLMLVRKGQMNVCLLQLSKHMPSLQPACRLYVQCRLTAATF